VNEQLATELLKAALSYAGRGWPVLPLKKGTKVPLGRLVPNGYRDATTDLHTIIRWWTEEPDANVGICVGQASGLAVLDVDPRNGGDESLFALQQVHGKFPETVEAITGGGGCHIFFKHPGGQLKNRIIAPGLDLKVEGGYVVAAPSGHPSGESYVWEVSSHPDDTALAPFPACLMQFLNADAKRATDSQRGTSKIPKGARNSTLASMAGSMRRAGFSEDAIAEALLRENQKKCDPPLNDREVQTIARSIGRYPAAGGDHIKTWPAPLSSEAYHGLAGELVGIIEPHTEADNAAILVQILIAFGNAIGRSAHFIIESDRHALNLYGILVGETARGRKGTSWGRVRQLFEKGVPDWTGERVQGGLSSGEGLVWAVRDAIEKQDAIKDKGRIIEYQTITVDHGVEDKRLLVLETEFASVLRMLERDGNTLSAIVRQAWDNGHLRVMTKNSPAKASGAHISIIGHITVDELRRHLKQTETANGFANRFLFTCVRRSKLLPEGGALQEQTLLPFIERLTAAIRFAGCVGEITVDEGARQLWREVYEELSDEKPGLLGAVTSRADPQVKRLAAIFALLDLSIVIKVDHLLAARAVWRYCEQSANYIFGTGLGDLSADRILQALRGSPHGLTRTELRDLFGRNKRGSDIEQALSRLNELGFVRKLLEETGVRPAERWMAVETTNTTDTTSSSASLVGR
jgi:hypothetical protein